MEKQNSNDSELARVYVRVRNRNQMKVLLKHFAEDRVVGLFSPPKIVDEHFSELFQYPTELHVENGERWDFGIPPGAVPMTFEQFLKKYVNA